MGEGGVAPLNRRPCHAGCGLRCVAGVPRLAVLSSVRVAWLRVPSSCTCCRAARAAELPVPPSCGHSRAGRVVELCAPLTCSIADPHMPQSGRHRCPFCLSC